MRQKVPGLVSLDGEANSLKKAFISNNSELEKLQVTKKVKLNYVQIYEERMKLQKASFAKTKRALELQVVLWWSVRVQSGIDGSNGL